MHYGFVWISAVDAYDIDESAMRLFESDFTAYHFKCWRASY